MVKAAKKRGLILGVLFGRPKEKSGKNKSVEYSCDWLREQVLRPGLPFEGQYDQRVRDCIEIFPIL